MNLLETPTNGRVIFEGNELSNHKNNLNKLRQKWAWSFKILIYFHKTVLNNIILAPKLLNKSDLNQLKQEALTFIRKVGLEDKANVYPSQLSGGQNKELRLQGHWLCIQILYCLMNLRLHWIQR